MLVSGKYVAHRPKNAVLQLSTDAGLTHDYTALAQTVSGTSGASSFTASATLATAAILPGSKVHIGASDHEYTVVSKSGTTLNVTPNLTQTYSGGTALKIDVVSAQVGDEGFGSSATQSTAANRPGFVPSYINGRNVVAFSMAAKALTLANNTATDNIFASGGTFTVGINAVSAGASNVGRIIEKVDSGGTACWNLIMATSAGGYAAIQFNQVTSGTTGTWTTGAVVLLSAAQIISITYNASAPTVAPVVRVQGVAVALTVTSAPTGTARSDAGGAYTIGNRAAGDRGFEGYHFVHMMWKRVLTDFELNTLERQLAVKWGSTLYNDTLDPTGRILYYGARVYVITRPTTPVGTKPLVLCLHGGTGSAAQFITQLLIGPLLGEEAVLVFPTATKNVDSENTWNSGGDQTFNRAPDSLYLTNLVDHIVANVVPGVVDTSKIFIVGHSNGAMMAYRLAIEYPTKWAGIFAMAGNVMVSNSGLFAGKIKHYHGQDDQNVPLAGGVGVGGILYPRPQNAVAGFTRATVDFQILASPAQHIVSSLATALVALSTTLPDEIYDFVMN